MPFRLEVAQDLRQALLHRLLLGVDSDFGVQGLLVRVGDAGEVLDLTPDRLLVEALHVATGQLFDAALGVDLDEVADELAVLVADLAIGRNRGGDNRDAVAAQTDKPVLTVPLPLRVPDPPALSRSGLGQPRPP